MKYRVKFSRLDAGWIIQQTRFGVFWLKIGDRCWKFEKDAKAAIEKIKNGEAPYWKD